MTTAKRIVLVGLSGVGKSRVGREVASGLGWSMIDVDDEIERAFGTTIPEIFRDHGEAEFRARERAILLNALTRDRAVIATGGGAVIDPAVWSADVLGHPENLVVALDAQPEQSFERLVAQQVAEGERVERPLLAGDDPLARLSAMKQARQEHYDAADITIVTDGAEPAGVANEIIWLLRQSTPRIEPTIQLRVPSGESAIYIGTGQSTITSDLIRHHWPRAQRVWIITDDIVGPLHAAAISGTIESAGIPVAVQHVPAGEASKNLSEASRLYDWLLSGGIERGDVIVALGGGVIGDLAGFVAATVLRGVGLVQIPTSLLAMVDSSVGGKTGVDHPAGKNLIGAFYQPPVVIIDPALLKTLPPRQVTNGWAEVVKHAIIQPSTPGGERADLLTYITRNQRAFAADSPYALAYLIWRNIALKAAVVTADEREAGIRAYLNFGHTLGHAIEAAGYEMLHGEAIAAGIRAEARLGVLMDSCSEADAERINQAVTMAGLPGISHADPETVLPLLNSDKKRAAGKLRWVLPVSGGGVTIRDDVPADATLQALLAVTKQRAPV